MYLMLKTILNFQILSVHANYDKLFTFVLHFSHLVVFKINLIFWDHRVLTYGHALIENRITRYSTGPSSDHAGSVQSAETRQATEAAATAATDRSQ